MSMDNNLKNKNKTVNYRCLNGEKFTEKYNYSSSEKHLNQNTVVILCMVKSNYRINIKIQIKFASCALSAFQNWLWDQIVLFDNSWYSKKSVFMKIMI